MEHSFVNGWVANATAEWFEWGVNGTQTVYYPDFVDVSGVFSQVNWNSKTWFYRENVAFAANETKVLKARVIVKPNSNGKYDLFAKLSSDSFQEAWDSGRYVLLDPWYNTSWSYRKAITLNEGNATERLNEPVIVNVTGLTGADNCSYVRVTGNYSTETALSFQVLDNSGSAYAAGSQYCLLHVKINLAAAQNATYAAANTSNVWVYYGNTTNTGSGEVADLGAWESDNVMWNAPVNDGWTTQIATGGSNATFSEYGHGNWEVNETAGRLLWFKVVTIPVTGFTMVGYAKSISGGYFTLLGVETASQHGACFNINNAGWNIEDYNLNVFNAGTTSTTDAFHEYRIISQGVTAKVYKDGALLTSITNVSAAIGAANQLHLGDLFSSAYKVNVKYLAWEQGEYPPLSYTVGAEESYVLPTALNLTCFDESTNASLTCDYVVSNSTGFTTTVTASHSYYNNTPTGALTIIVSKTGFSSRTYYTTYVDSTVSAFRVYLLNNSISTVHAIAVFTVTSAYGTVAGADVNLSKMVGGSPVLVASGVTDGFGTTSFFVDSTSSYQLSAFKTGYGGVIMTLTNPLLTTYTIVFSSGVATAIPVNCLTGVSSALTPNSRQLFRGGNQTVSWVISSANSSLSYWGWRVDWNGTIVNTSNYTVAAGGSTNYLMDFVASNATGLVGVQYYWNNGVGADCVRNDVFFVNNVTGNTGLLGALSSLKTDTGIGDNALSLLALIIIVSMVVFASRYTTVGGAAIGIITLAFFTFITGWINPIFFLLLAIGGIAWTYFAYERGF
jgi:hypothetical protein